MEARIEKLMDLVFELKQDVAALKDKSSSGTEPEPTNKTWTVTVTKEVTDKKVVTYKLTGSSESVTVSADNVTLKGDSSPYSGFTFDITSPTQPDIETVTYDGSPVEKSNITVAEKQQ